MKIKITGNTANHKVLTRDGFRDFDGIIDYGVAGDMCRVTFDDGQHLDCTAEHRIFLDSYNDFAEVSALDVGDVCSGKVITDISPIEGSTVYDLLNVKDTSSYSAAGVENSNCGLISLDEFAFVDGATEFYAATYPVISAGSDTKIIITSTANGMGNMFHQIWSNAIAGKNLFVPFRVDWWDVPGRDEKWKADTIANTSALQFAQEFGNDFFQTGNTLISGDILKELRDADPIRTGESGRMRIFRDPEPDHTYVITADTGHGKQQDFSAFSVFDVTQHGDSMLIEQVAAYSDDGISPMLYPYVIAKWGRKYNSAYLIVENNDVGMMVATALYKDIEYENMYMESSVKSDSMGIRITVKTKRMGAMGLQEMLQHRRLIINDIVTITELSTYVARKSSYSAGPGYHDDMVSTLILLGWFIQTRHFSDLFSDSDGRLADAFYRDEIRKYTGDEDEVPPVGILGDMAGPFADMDTDFVF